MKAPIFWDTEYLIIILFIDIDLDFSLHSI